jgi:hypothetical protein
MEVVIVFEPFELNENLLVFIGHQWRFVLECSSMLVLWLFTRKPRPSHGCAAHVVVRGTGEEGG